MRIYVASSWRNMAQPGVVASLRAAGHEVYDFKNPRPGDNGFHWSAVDGGWKSWDAGRFRAALSHPIAEAGYRSDKDAMDWADACVLVMPCGRSAHLEAGFMAGAGKPVAVLLDAQNEPELMYKLLGRICLSLDEVVHFLKAGS